jgi:hypothetical protein
VQVALHAVDPAAMQVAAGTVTYADAQTREGVPMKSTKDVLTQAYAAFNRRDIDAALALMTENVSWPKASEGGRVIGKEEIRAYWTRQWAEFDPHVELMAMHERADGRADAEVHQVVKSLEGEMLSDSVVRHVYTLSDTLIERMDLATETPDAFGPRH